MRNVIDIYSDVAEKMKDLNEVEKSAAIFGLGGTYHRQRLQVLLEDLGSADSMYRKMYETSVNSAGSAMIENEKYMKSLQARINSVRIEFEKLAVGIGEAFLQDGMIEFLKMSSSFLGAVTDLVDTVGVLPIVLGAASMAILTFSNRAQTLTGALSAKTMQMIKANTATIKYSQSVNQGIVNTQRYIQATNTATLANRRLTMSSTALVASSARMNAQLVATKNTMNLTAKAGTMLATVGRTIGSAFVWTLPFVALGFLIEKLTSASAKTRELKESADSANKELLNSFKSNQDEIDSLLSKYKQLEDEISKGNYDNSTLAEYYDIQNKIAQLMPSLITGESQYGTKLVESSNVIQSKVDVLKQQLELEQQIAEWQAKQDRDARIEGNTELAKDNLEAANEELSTIQRRLEYIMNTGGNIEGKISVPKIENIDDLTNYLDKIAEQRKLAEAKGDNDAIEYYDKLANAVMESQNSLNGFNLAYQNAQSAKKVDFISKINDTLKTNESLWDNNTDGVSNFAGELLQLSDIDSVDNLNEALSSIALNGTASDEIKTLISDFTSLKNATDKNFDEIVVKAQSSMSALETALQSSGLSDVEIQSVMASLNSKMNTTKASHAELIAEMEKGNISWTEAVNNLANNTDATETLGESTDDLTSKMLDFKDAVEQVAGVSQGGIDAVNDLIFQYDMLSNQLSRYSDEEIYAAQNTDKLSAEQILIKDLLSQRVGVMQQLSSVYPNLLGFDGKAIELSEQKREAMEKENKANQVLLEAYKLAREGKLNSEQTMTLTAAQGAKNRIEILKRELLALDVVIQKYNEEASKLTATSTDDGADKQLMSAISKRTTATNELNMELDGLANISVDLDSIVTKVTESEKASTKSAKESNATKKESVYLSDKYKQSLEKLNLEIERQQAIQSKHPEHSEAYRKSLEAQLKLEREKLNLIKSQSASLDKQIKSGKIAQTGNITLDDSNSKSTITSPTQRKLGGWNNRITSEYGMRMHPTLGHRKMHNGIDIAAPLGTKLDSNVNGKVVSQGYNDVSGNFIKIEDTNGFKHFYGHLEKALVEAGDTIEKGMQIGTIGSTGRSTGSHLHYEVKDSGGNYINPKEFVKAAQGVQTIAKDVTGVVATNAQSIDEARSTLNGLHSDAINSQKAIDDLVQATIDSQLASFEYRRSTLDAHYSHEEEKLKNVNKESSRYNATLDKMSNLLERKQNVNREELEVLDELINSGNLSAIELERMENQTLALKTAMQELNDSIGQLALDKIEGFYNTRNEKNNYILEYERTKLEGVDFNSPRYIATLEKIYKHQGLLYENTLSNIKDIENEIISKGLTGDALHRANEEIARLTNEMRTLENDMSQTQFEITVNVKTKSDEIIDDLQFEIDRSKAIQSLYDEGSLEYNNEIDKQIELYKEQAKIHDESRRKHQEELLTRKMLPNEIKATTEALEDETLAYWAAIGAIEELTKAQKENVEQARKDIAEDAINALKDAYQEFQDDKMRHLDEELESAEKLHEKRMKQLEDEMELYRKNVQEKLDLIDKQEAERDYNMEIDEMEANRNEVQSEYDGLSMDNSYEATKRKAELEKELDEIDKEIAEKRHDRNIELQKENLNNLLEDKEVEIEKREELEESRHEKVVSEIEREREYWQKHFTDLLNDERKFAEIRKDIIAGNIDKVQKEFDGYIDDLYETMPELVDTLNGTMEAVGTAIRQNVIDNLRLAMDEYENLLNKQSELSSSGKKYEDDFDPNKGKDSLNTLDNSSNGVGVGKYADKLTNTSSNSGKNDSSTSTGKGQMYETLSNSDYRVMLGKYLVDILSTKYKDVNERKAIKEEGHRIAKLGRDNGSIIPVMSHFDSELNNFSSSQIDRLKSFTTSNAPVLLGGKYEKEITKGIASLDSGGFIKRFGQGIDGKGGGLSIVHPNEVIESPYDVDQLVKHSTILDKVMSMVAPALSKLPQLKLPAMQGMMGDNIEVHFHVDEMIANKSTADSFATRYAEKVRTAKGGFRK